MIKKVNIRMTKPGSSHIIEIASDPDDSHFCTVVHRKARSGIAVESHLILASDVPQWIGMYEREGYKKQQQ